MNSLRKWLYKPKKTDKSLLAQFYFADEELNTVATELDSFDSRKDPERCQALVTQLRSCQDKVLTIIQRMMDEAIPFARTPRDFRVKFPDDVVQENLSGQLWFGAECLAAGSSIMNREVESATMRPLARALTKNLDSLRCILRDQCLMNMNEYSERIREALLIFDKLFAEFELSYVSAMVPVKSVKEYETIQEITVLFSETVLRAKQLGYITTDMIDEYDPALMFTIPRLAIISGLLMYPDGPLNPDSHSWNMSDMFRPFQTLLYKIRELLYTLTEAELLTLERALCSQDEPAFLVSTCPNAATSTSTAAVQTDALPPHTQEMLEDSQSCSSAERQGSEEDVSCSTAGSLDSELESSSQAVANVPGILSESVSCGAICCHTDAGSRLDQEDVHRSRCLNKCDSNDSGLHSDGVSNSDSQYTISSSDSHQLLSNSALSSPLLSPSTDTFPEDVAAEGEDSHFQQRQSTPEASVQDKFNISFQFTTGSIENTQDRFRTHESDTNLSEASIASDLSQASVDTISASNARIDSSVGGEVDHTTGILDVEEEEESFYSASPGDSPLHQPHHSSPPPLQAGSTSAGSVMCSFQCQGSAENRVEKLAASSCHGCGSSSDNSDSVIAEARHCSVFCKCEQPSTMCSEVDGTKDNHRCDEQGDLKNHGDKTNYSNSTRNVPNRSYIANADNESRESLPGVLDNCDNSETARYSPLQELCGALQSVQTIVTADPSANDSLEASDVCDSISYDSNSTEETITNVTDPCLLAKTPSSCDSAEQILCDNEPCNQNDCTGAMEGKDFSQTLSEDGPVVGKIGEDLPHQSRRLQCDRCTQTPHSAINNAQSSKIHHHHSRQHSNIPPTLPPAGSTGSSASSQAICDNCDTSSTSGKNKTSPPSPPELSHSQAPARKRDSSVKTEKRSSRSATSTHAHRTPKAKSHGAKLKSPASSSAARLKQYADNWSDCSSGSDADKAVNGIASGSSGCEGSSSASDCEWDQESCSSSETSSYNSECHDDEEIALAVQAAELASRNHARRRFRSSSDMIHRLFVCISGVADQLQTNFAGDLRNILRVVFNLNCSEPVVMEDEKTFRRHRRYGARSLYRQQNGNGVQGGNSGEPPAWIPDDQSTMCMSCKTPFSFVRRRHHCRNCGKIFCGRCSSNAVSLPHFGHTKPVRVCNRCFMFQVTPFTMQGHA